MYICVLTLFVNLDRYQDIGASLKELSFGGLSDLWSTKIKNNERVLDVVQWVNCLLAFTVSWVWSQHQCLMSLKGILGYIVSSRPLKATWDSVSGKEKRWATTNYWLIETSMSPYCSVRMGALLCVQKQFINIERETNWKSSHLVNFTQSRKNRHDGVMATNADRVEVWWETRYCKI